MFAGMGVARDAIVVTVGSVPGAVVCADGRGLHAMGKKVF
jgi:hypothetical protein